MGQRFPLGGWASSPPWLAVKAKGQLGNSSVHKVLSGLEGPSW